MKALFQKNLYRYATIVELFVGVVVLVACVISGLGMVFNTDVKSLFESPDYFQSRLNIACFIIIGVEFIKMIASHTLDSVVDVMMLALARQMVIEHTEALENIVTVLAVCLLFVVRKYLYVSKIDKLPENVPHIGKGFGFCSNKAADMNDEDTENTADEEALEKV